jgi:hypothetical protein
VAERVAHAFPHAAEPTHLELRDAGALGGELDELGDRVKADGDRDQADPVPQEELPEGVALGASDRVEANGGQPQAEPAGQEPLEQRLAAQRGHERDAEQRQREELGRAEGEDERAHEGNGQPQDERAEHRAHQ